MTVKGKAKSWRDVLPIHPAAELFPMMSPDELRELGEDIKKNGMKIPIILSAVDDREHPLQVLDGRNRLDAMAAVGILHPTEWGELEVTTPSGDRERLFTDLVSGRADEPIDPHAFVLSANLHRRHLTAEQKREIITKVLKAAPQKSDRQIAKTVKVSDKTVGAVRAKLERRAEIPHIDTRADTKGRKQPAKRKRRDVDDFLADKRARAKECDKQSRTALEPAQSNALSRDAQAAIVEGCLQSVRELIARALPMLDARGRRRLFNGLRRLIVEMKRQGHEDDPQTPTRAVPDDQVPADGRPTANDLDLPEFLDRTKRVSPAAE